METKIIDVRKPLIKERTLKEPIVNVEKQIEDCLSLQARPSIVMTLEVLLNLRLLFEARDEKEKKGKKAENGPGSEE